MSLVVETDFGTPQKRFQAKWEPVRVKKTRKKRAEG